MNYPAVGNRAFGLINEYGRGNPAFPRDQGKVCRHSRAKGVLMTFRSYPPAFAHHDVIVRYFHQRLEPYHRLVPPPVIFSSYMPTQYAELRSDIGTGYATPHGGLHVIYLSSQRDVIPALTERTRMHASSIYGLSFNPCLIGRRHYAL